MKYRLFLWKRWIEDILITPFIWIGRAFADKYPLRESYEIYLFFPFYHTGGAEKVHAQIAQVFRNRKCLVIFTRRSQDDGFRKAFEASGHRVLDISAYTDNKKTYWKNLVWRGVVSSHINRQASLALVFNGQCNFAYKCSRWIKPSIPQVELIHSFNSFSWIRIPFLPFYRQTVMISRKAMADHAAQYQQLGIPKDLYQRITLIPNGIPLPASAAPKTFDGRELRVLYVGRATPEKRVQLVAEAARQARQAGKPYRFTFAGDIREQLPAQCQDAGTFLGSIDNPEQLQQVYREQQVVIITSSEEGFPLAVMEGMAMGCLVLATPVGDLSYHIRPREQGYLFSSTEPETVVRETLTFLDALLADPAHCAAMSAANIRYAHEHFGLPTFARSYQALVDQLMPPSETP